MSDGVPAAALCHELYGCLIYVKQLQVDCNNSSTIVVRLLQAHCDSLPVATVERYQLLQAAVAMLPGGVQSAHAEELLLRHHHEHLEPQVMRQVIFSSVSPLLQ